MSVPAAVLPRPIARDDKSQCRAKSRYYEKPPFLGRLYNGGKSFKKRRPNSSLISEWISTRSFRELGPWMKKVK